MTEILLHTDGSCSGNPGPGGWAVAVCIPGRADTLLRGGHPSTTNNAMEMLAALKGLEAVLGSAPEQLAAGGVVRLRSDSEYVLKGLTEWLPSWKSRGWKTAAGKPVKNKDAWQDLDRVVDQIRQAGATFAAEHIKGHSGDPWNDRMDRAAVEATEMSRQTGNAWFEVSHPDSPDAALPEGVTDDIPSFRHALEARGYRFYATSEDRFDRGLLQRDVHDDAGLKYYLTVRLFEFPAPEGPRPLAEMSVQFHTQPDLKGRAVNISSPVTLEDVGEVEGEMERIWSVMGYGHYELRVACETPPPGA